MSKKTWIIGGVAVLAIAGATILGRSLNHANDSKGSTGSNKVTTLKVAHTQNYVPYDFVDEKGESDGYEVAVLKAIDEKLPDYKFEYEKKMRINTRTLMTLLKKKENWFQFHHKMHNGMLLKNTMKSIRTNKSN